MSLSDVIVQGTGSRGVLVSNLKVRNRKPVWAVNPNAPIPNNALYKISTETYGHDVEIENAKYLSQIDVNQRYFVFPVATYTMSGDPKLLHYVDKANQVPNKQFDVRAKTMYVDVIPFAGKSLKKLKDDGFRFTPRQAKLAIKFLMQGLIKLHEAGISHGDVHPHNVLIHVYQNGNVLARWIDFGEMKRTYEHQRDTKQFIGIIKMIIGMVNSEDNDLNAIYTKVSHGIAHMNAMGLAFDISSLLSGQHTKVSTTASKRKRSTSSSASGSRSRSEVKKALQF